VDFGDSKPAAVISAERRFRALPLKVPFKVNKLGETTVTATLNLVYCREDNTGVCYIKTLVWKAPVRFVRDGKAARKIEFKASLR
jgi:hypothetical protein